MGGNYNENHAVLVQSNTRQIKHIIDLNNQDLCFISSKIPKPKIETSSEQTIKPRHPRYPTRPLPPPLPRH